MHTAAPMHLYDTSRGEVTAFAPGETVTMYVCGITPYDATHLGHAATYVTYDVLQRRLIDRIGLLKHLIDLHPQDVINANC